MQTLTLSSAKMTEQKAKHADQQKGEEQDTQSETNFETLIQIEFRQRLVIFKARHQSKFNA